MPLLHNRLSVIVFWLTFTQLQLTGQLTDWLVADLLTDLVTSLLTNLLTNWLAYCFNYWLADWLTDCVADRLLDLPATILITNCWNKTRFSRILWKISHIQTSHLCSHSNVPLSFPNVELRIFWSTEMTVIPKSTLGKGKITQVFQDQFCDEYCSSLTNRLDWLANVLRFILRKGIDFNAFMLWIKITAIADQNDWFFISDQICPADVSRRQQPGFWAYLQYCKCFIGCFVIQLLSEPDKLKLCSLFKVRWTYSFINF